MRAEAPDLDKLELIRLLNAEYGLDIAALTFVPKGADSYGYLAEATDGRRFFVKAHDTRRMANAHDLERALRVVHHLRAHCGLPFALAANANRWGQMVCPLGNYIVAVFDFIEGATAFEKRLTLAERDRVAEALAWLHHTGSWPEEVPPEVETFTLPFKALLLNVLDTAAATTTWPREDQWRLRELLDRERSDILATMEKVEQLGCDLRDKVQLVVIHGEPSAGNILRMPAGELYLIDWGEVALGPAERDLSSFAGEGFESFLAHYVSVLNTPSQLRAEVFGFYFYRWALSEIADYGLRIFFGPPDPEELAYAWEELPDYLPIQHKTIEAGVEAVRKALRRVVG